MGVVVLRDVGTFIRLPFATALLELTLSFVALFLQFVRMRKHHLNGLQYWLSRHWQVFDDMAVPRLPGAYIRKNIVLPSYPPSYRVGKDVLGVRNPIDHFFKCTAGLEYYFSPLNVLMVEPSKKRETCDVLGDSIAALFETEILPFKS